MSYELDCLGDICPIPILKIEKELVRLNNGETIKIVSDHSCTVSSVKSYCEAHEFDFNFEEVFNGIYEIYISKRK